MKGLVLAAGRGTRLRPLTYARPKPLIRVANRPIIDYALEAMLQAGCDELGIVVSPDTRPDIALEMKSLPNGSHATLVMQETPLGIAHAVASAEEFLAGEPFMLYLGDNLFEHGLEGFIETFHAEQASAVVALVQVADPRAFGVAVIEQGRIVRLVEKPREPPSDLALAGVYVFGPEVHEVIKTLQPSHRGELEITDAIQGLVERGRTVVPRTITGWWKDTGRPEDLLDANRLLLENLEPRIEGAVDSASQITGRVQVHASATVQRSVIRGPALIGPRAVIRDSYVGPYTSIGAGVEINGAEVEYSVVQERSVIDHPPVRLQDSLIGCDVRVSRSGLRPISHRLILGDHSVVELP